MKHSITSCWLTILTAATTISCISQQQVCPLRHSANGRYLVDAHNIPYPVLGRTAWFVISLPVDQYHQFIGNTTDKGFNAIEMHVLGHDPRGNNAPFNGEGDLPFLRRLDGKAWDGKLVYTNAAAEAPDMTTPNEKYWTYVDHFLAYCDSQKVTVFMFPGYVGAGGGEQGWMQELVANGPGKTSGYGSFVANRYKQQKNLVWMLLGDMGTFTASQKEAEAALIKGLKSIAGQQSTQYSAEGNSGQNSRDQEDFGDQMTLNGVYDWEGKVAVLGRKAYAQKPVMPAFLLEEPYDEEGQDGNKYNPSAVQPVRRFQYWGWLSSIGGYICGNGYVWGFRSPGWQDHLDTKAARQMSLLNKFIRSIQWWELVPSGLEGLKNLVTQGGSTPEKEDYVAAAANTGGTLLIAYVPPAHRGIIELDMSVLHDGIQAEWRDPTNWKRVGITGTASPYNNKGKQQFSVPGPNSEGEQDWVLVLTSQ